MNIKNKKHILLIAFIAINMASFCQGTVKVRIEKIRKETGKIYVSMANKANDFKKQSVIKADSKNYNIVFENVPPGVYSIQVCQDENSNGALDKFLGMPKEPVGFSQNPTLMFGAPSFEQSSFAVAHLEVKSLSIKLKSIF